LVDIGALNLCEVSSFISHNSSSLRRMYMHDPGVQLILAVTASYLGAVGFGDLFDCEIKRVVAGTMDEPRMQLSILAGEKDKLRFISEHVRPTQIEIGFTVHQKCEPYSMAPISGFVDRSQTSWKIEFMREAKE
jgi:hypothetical protein